MKCYFVNAFSERADGGNPAAVCVLENWPADEKMLAVARKNNLSETAFCVREDGDTAERREAACGKGEEHVPRYHIRWFTPSCEVPLCGHATIATACILFRFFYPESKEIIFDSQSGRLAITRRSNLYELDFPAYTPKTIYAGGKTVTADDGERALVSKTLEALEAGSGKGLKNGIKPIEIFMTCDVVAVFDNPAYIREFKPCLEKIEELSEIHGNGTNCRTEVEGLIITAACARGSAALREADAAREEEEEENISDRVYDFISRCFYPSEGIDEDPVTGSAHCSLAPYWHKVLKKNNLRGYQASERGGEVCCRIEGERVKIGGTALFLRSDEICPD